jgi:hypothetical protein
MIGMMRVNDPAGVRIKTTPETDALMTDKDVTAGITASQNQPARISQPESGCPGRWKLPSLPSFRASNCYEYMLQILHRCSLIIAFPVTA